MAKREELFYPTEPKIAARIQQAMHEHINVLEQLGFELTALGADRNDVLSCLAQLAAIDIDMAVTMMGFKIKPPLESATREQYEADPGVLAMKLFCADAVARTIVLQDRHQPTN